MNQDELDIELIENYFNKKLTPVELQRFGERIKTDVDFAEKTDDYKEIIQGIRLNAHEDFKNEVAGWEAEIKNEDKPTKPLYWKSYLAVAATILLLIVATLYFFIPHHLKSEQELFTAYFVPYEDVISVRGSSLDGSLERAMSLYNERKYNEAIPYFKSYLAENTDNINAQFYLATSWLALRNTSEAIPVFQHIIKENGTYHDQAEWSLCLALLLDNNKSSAREHLEKIASDTSHTFYKESKELLAEMN